MDDNVDVTDLLDADLDDLEDLPEFKPFEPGAHKVLATFEEKEINGKKAVELAFKLVETLELTDPQGTPDVPGTECNMAFFLHNKFGVGNLKKMAKPFAVAFELSTTRQVIKNVDDVECLILTSTKKDKTDPDRLYLNVKELQVVS